MSVPFLAQRPGIGVHQRRKLVEMRNDYHLVDETGREVGTAQQVRQTPLAFLARLFSNLDRMLP
nr:scramblase [Euzebyales bacterium]